MVLREDCLLKRETKGMKVFLYKLQKRTEPSLLPKLSKNPFLGEGFLEFRFKEAKKLKNIGGKKMKF